MSSSVEICRLNPISLISPLGRPWRILATAVLTVLLLSTAARAEDSIGQPVREELSNGGYKMIYKNQKGQVVWEVTYTGKGRMRKKVRYRYYENGKLENETDDYYTYDEDGFQNLGREVVTDFDVNTEEPISRQIRDWTNHFKITQVWKDDAWDTLTEQDTDEEDARNKSLGYRAPAGTSFERSNTGVALFRTGEVQLGFSGIGGVGHDEHLVTDEHTVKETRTVTEVTLVPMTTEEDLPGKPGLTPVTTNVPVPTKHDVTAKKTVKHTRNDAAMKGGFGGLGADAKYFATQNIGIGVQGDWMDDSSIGDFMGTVTARFPMGSNAPYVFGGAGVQVGDRTQAVGELGGGIEHRFSPNTGVFVDASWLVGEHENAAVFRAGVSLVFGPQELPPPSKK